MERRIIVVRVPRLTSRVRNRIKIKLCEVSCVVCSTTIIEVGYRSFDVLDRFIGEGSHEQKCFFRPLFNLLFVGFTTIQPFCFWY